VGVPMHDRPEDAMDSHHDATVGIGVHFRIKGSVLLAEDGADNQALITTRLRQTGLKVEVAPNGEVACEKALAALKQDNPFDLILMDVQMPVMDGFSATLHLRSQGYRGPVIALTANAMERDRNKCLNAGCNDFVTKPIDVEKLFKAIGRYLRVEKVAATADEPVLDDAKAAGRETQVNEFFAKLGEELEEIEEAVERQDRVRLKELVQLIMGNAATLDLRDLASQSAKLLFAAEKETSWPALDQAVNEFAKDARPPSKRQAA